jgi:hypothetical protein
VTGAIVVVGGVVLYLRFVRGWRWSDMMYVTKASLAAMQESVTSSEWAPKERGLGAAAGGSGRLFCRPPLASRLF